MVPRFRTLSSTGEAGSLPEKPRPTSDVTAGLSLASSGLAVAGHLGLASPNPRLTLLLSFRFDTAVLINSGQWFDAKMANRRSC